MSVLMLIAGFVLGGVVAFLWLRLKTGNETRELNGRIALAEDKLHSLEAEKLEFKEEIKLKSSIEINLNTRLAEEKAKREAIEIKLAEQKLQVEDIQLKFKSEFENIASKLLEEKGEKLLERNKEKIDAVLNPLKENIEKFEKEIRDSKEASVRSHSSLSQQLKQVQDLGMKMSEEAKNLTTALRGDNKMQGNWGELILERVLEMSGLKRGEEYEMQFTVEGMNGNKQILDAIIYLPDNKHLIVDSKVSLNAYEAFVNAQDEAERQQYLRDHKLSLANHIKGLAEKHYIGAKNIKSPDFVLMFIPIEACLSMSLQSGGEQLFEFAWQRKVVLVAPSTLLATLKTVASIWKYERQNANWQKIADMGKLLYDQINGFLIEMEKIGEGIRRSQTAYDEALFKLRDGSQSVLKRARKLEELGIKPKKAIDKKWDSTTEEESPISIEEGKSAPPLLS